MINPQQAQWLISIILLIIAYFISVTINGIIQAFVADKLGDSTAKEAGFLSPNAFMHMDILSFLGIFTFLIVGWGFAPRFVPIEPSRIIAKNRLLRIAAIYATEPIVSFLLALIVALAGAAVFGLFPVIKLSIDLFARSDFDLHLLLQQYSYISVLGALFVAAMVFLNVFFAVTSFIASSFKYVMIVGFERNYSYIEYSDVIMLLGPIIIIFLYTHTLSMQLFGLIIKFIYLSGLWK